MFIQEPPLQQIPILERNRPLHAAYNFPGLLSNWVLSKSAFQFAYPFDVILISAALPVLSMWPSKRKLDEEN